MDSNIIAAVIGATGVVVAALLGLFGKRIKDSYRIRSKRYPNIRGQWAATWYVDGQDDVYNETTIIFEKIRGLNIYGKESAPKKDPYKIQGTYSPNLIINLIYESTGESYSLSGVMTLKIDSSGKKCTGHWCGYTEEEQIRGGTVNLVFLSK